MSFTAAEIEFLGSQPLARLATTDASGQPDVVPVAFELDGTNIWIGGPGDAFLSTRKVRNITSGARSVALVVDDMVSFDPFIARGVGVKAMLAWALCPLNMNKMTPSGWT